MSASVLQFESVSFRYPRGAPVLQDVDLTLAPGQAAAVIGPNGGGKTTLLRLALGLLTPTAGTVRLLGASPRKSRQRCGYVAQHLPFDPRFPITVREVVAQGLARQSGLPWLTRAERVAVGEVLGFTGLDGHAGDPFATLSGGQRQRALIARALVRRPTLLFLDEPTAMVDADMEAQLSSLLQELRKETTLVVVSHDVGFVGAFVDRVFCVYRTVDEHPTTRLTRGEVATLYGTDVRQVHHDVALHDHGHSHHLPPSGHA